MEIHGFPEETLETIHGYQLLALANQGEWMLQNQFASTDLDIVKTTFFFFGLGKRQAFWIARGFTFFFGWDDMFV